MTEIPYEALIRFGFFGGILAVMGLWEMLAPKRPLVEPRTRRWFTNLALVVIDSLILRIFFPILALGFAFWLNHKGWGLFAWLSLPAWIEIVAAVILLDLAIYVQHVAAHKISILWIFHRVHHADRDIDVTTGLRFHPVEIVLSMLYKMAVIALLGPAGLAVFIFEVGLNGLAMFNHSNVRLPAPADRIVRALVVTPDMHRVHHSVIKRETDSNYGFNLSVWDRLFGTYIDQPRAGHDKMTIGLPAYRDSNPSRLLWCLKLPFTRR